MVAEVIDNTTSRGRTLRFLYDSPHDEFKKALYALGEPPLPPFIHRPAEPEDEERFQTIYAKMKEPLPYRQPVFTSAVSL